MSTPPELQGMHLVPHLPSQRTISISVCMACGHGLLPHPESQLLWRTQLHNMLHQTLLELG